MMTAAKTTTPPNVWSCRIESVIGICSVPKIISDTCHSRNMNQMLNDVLVCIMNAMPIMENETDAVLRPQVVNAHGGSTSIVWKSYVSGTSGQVGSYRCRALRE